MTALHSDAPVLRPMHIGDFDSVTGLLANTAGVSLRSADSREMTERYLSCNPGLSFVAEAQGQLVGCIMSGHDGRRGYIQHLAVLPAYRGKGTGSRLVDACLHELGKLYIFKAHIDVLATNLDGQRFWERKGWILREDIRRYSFISSEDRNA